jgi:4-amino-4-deoxy-L-arabinose transferase-like glycosyltransferase
MTKRAKPRSARKFVLQRASLLLILLLAAVLRLYDLSSVPSELIVDEIDLYNSAHSIVTTGHDVDGTLRPFLYARFTRNPPLYAVAGYASSLIFGKTPFGLRLPAVLFGLISIALLYGIALELTQRRRIALLAALMMAIAPLFIQFSRVAWEPSSELPPLLGGIYLLLLALRRSTPARLAWAAILLGLTAYTYMAGWFYALVLAGPLLVLYATRRRSWRTVIAACATAALWLVVSLPALWMWFFDVATSSRALRIATFGHGVSVSGLRTFALNYFAHFRWSYLVVTGDPQSGLTWRYLNGFGAFYWWMIPLAAVGVLVAFQYVRGRALALWVWWWLVTYPLGGALTNEGAPNAPRTLAGAPVFCLLAAMGFTFLLDEAGAIRWTRLAHVTQLLVRAAFATAAVTSVAWFSWIYFAQYVHRDSNAWDSGTRAMFETLIAHRAGYHRVCFAVLPAWYDPASYSRFYLDDDGLRWIDNVEDPRCSQPGALLAVDPHHLVEREGFKPIATIRDVDGRVFAYISGRLPR